MDVQEGDGADAEAEELVGFFRGGGAARGGGEWDGFGEVWDCAGAGGDEFFLFWCGFGGRGRENGHGGRRRERGARARGIEFGRRGEIDRGCGYPDADHAGEEPGRGVDGASFVVGALRGFESVQ